MEKRNTSHTTNFIVGDGNQSAICGGVKAPQVAHDNEKRQSSQAETNTTDQTMFIVGHGNQSAICGGVTAPQVAQDKHNKGD